VGIRSWFGRGEPEAPAPQHPGPPTEDQLLGALDRVEQQARDGQVPGVVLSRLLRVTGIVRNTVPRLADLGIGSTQGYSVMATATDYLPVAIGNYLRLPRDWADTRPIANGKSSVMLLVDQLDLLGATMDKVYDAVLRSDAEAIIVHGQFLEQKFGAGSGGGSLGLDAPDPTPQTMPNGRGSAPAPGRLAPPEQ
jgi:hypothetical protein